MYTGLGQVTFQPGFAFSSEVGGLNGRRSELLRDLAAPGKSAVRPHGSGSGCETAKSPKLKTSPALVVFCLLYCICMRYNMPMPNSFSQLEQRRDQILQQMKAIDRLRRGSLSRQFFKKPGCASQTQQGPYYVLQGYIQGQKFSERVPADQAPQIEPLVANYKRFEQLAEEFVNVTDQLTRLSQSAPDAKKNSRRKSARSGSAKPTPSSD